MRSYNWALWLAVCLVINPVEAAWCHDSPPDGLCHIVATPATGPFRDILRNEIDKAAARSEPTMIRTLIWQGADTDWVRNTKWYGRAHHEEQNRDLVHASAIGDFQLILNLLHAGADVNAKAHVDELNSPLIWAARCDQAAAVQTLLGNRADVDIKGESNGGSMTIVEGSTPLMRAATYGNIDVIKILLAKGADPNAQDMITFNVGKPNVKQKGNTPLVDAANRQTTELLLDAHANPNLVGARGISALMKAAGNGDIDQCKLLLARGANPLLRDMDGQNAAAFAKDAQYPEIADLLERVTSK